MVQTCPDILEIVSPGMGVALQDLGGPGLKRFGVAAGGAMDDHAAAWANRLLENDEQAPVLELLMQGAHLRMLRDTWIALTGASAGSPLPMWQTVYARAGDDIRFSRCRSGVWSYLAVEHGFLDHNPAQSHPMRLTGWLGRPLAAGTILRRRDAVPYALPPRVAARLIHPAEARDYKRPPAIKVWPGPQQAEFDPDQLALLWNAEWIITSRSNRVGYRLSGPNIVCNQPQLVSEPIREGTIQVPAGGQPIITMRDGPTVGGYPKIGMVDPRDLSWVSQISPGKPVRFEPAS